MTAPTQAGAPSDVKAARTPDGVVDNRSTPARALTPRQMLLVVALLGALITASATWAAVSLDRRNEHRLLEVQTHQAGAVIASTILSLSDPLTTVLKIEEATAGSTRQFGPATSGIVGAGHLFVFASLWATGGPTTQQLTTAGEPVSLPIGSAQERRLVQLALRSGTFVVSSLTSGGVQRIAYAVASSGSPQYVVYAERAIPANRQVPVESSAAFAELHFATYLGRAELPSALTTTDVSPDQLPFKGDTSRELIPFGNTSVLLVTSARGPLGGTLGQELPWVFLLVGALMTTAAATTGYQLVARRRRAEGDSRTITALYDELGTLYGQQRTIAETLQKALLPAYNPVIAELALASRYVAGAKGVDIGGDWFSIVKTGEHHFAFVIGDVSGRGVSAASIMARLRFTIRAYVLEGHSPEKVLSMCGQQLDIDVDGHFATVVVGIGDLRSREIVLANAGHLDPLLITGSDPQYVVTKTGLPVGISANAVYVPTLIVMPPGSTLLVFTDGLVERRAENIDDGLERLRQAAKTPAESLDDLLSVLVTELTDNQSEDDIALLAFRWL